MTDKIIATEKLIVQQILKEDGTATIQFTTEGDHQNEDAGADASLAYILIMAMVALASDGTLFKRAETVYGINLNASEPTVSG